jgi:protein required for attachment to host cells
MAMGKIKIGAGDWIVVCDGRKALILENTGDAKFPNLHMRETYEHPDEPTHAQGVSPPGRSHQSMGTRRSAVRQTDWHDQAERTFLHNLAERLDSAVTAGQTKAVTMVAAPRALGMIREAYSPAVRHAVAHEIAKDIVKMPIHEIEHFVLQSAN